jgi:CHAT domain-containing protein
MRKQIFFWVTILSFSSALSAQCPDRAEVLHQVLYLRDSSGKSNREQLELLLPYLKKINQCPKKNDSVSALLLSRIGLLYSTQHDLTSAISYTQQAIDMIEAHLGEPAIAASHLLKYYNNLCNFYDSTGQKSLADRAADSCISISIRLGKTNSYFSYHINRKMASLFSRGDYFHCLELATIAEDLSKRSGYHPEYIFNYYAWEINSLIFLKRYPQASAKTELALTRCIQSGNKNYMGTLLGLKATIAEKNGSAAEAVRFAVQSFYYEKKDSNYSSCASALSNLGYDLYFKRLHQYTKALLYYTEALKYANGNDSLTILNNIANIYVEKGDFQKALDFFQRAFNQIHPGADERFFLNNALSDILNSWNVEYIMNIVLDKAEVFDLKYQQTKSTADLESALSIYKTADRLMEKINSNQEELSSQLFWRSDLLRLYERALEACYQTKDLNNAFYFFEKSRAVLLNNQLREQETGDAHIIAIAASRKKILELENQSSALVASSRDSADLHRMIFNEKEQLHHLDQMVKESNPWYYQSLVDTNFISLQQVQNKFRAGKTTETVLEFFIGDSAVFIFYLGLDSSSIIRIDKSIFESTVARYKTYLSSPSMENSDFGGFVSTSTALYRMIFDPLPKANGRVIISPDEDYFPFESLVSGLTSAATPVYFVSDHAVSYTYSVRFLLNDFEKNRTLTPENFLGMAPVNYPGSFDLPSLPGSDRSLQSISTRFTHANDLVNSKASRNNFMQQFPHYRIIQLYTHASDSSSRGEPVIYFADSALYLSELIPENKTAAQLVVLSACQTGNGKLYRGEGVFSFNRGFASLGIPSSVINLWAVDNESTYRLTELFYQYVSSGLPLDISLQKAKLDFIARSSKEKQLPYYWAAAIIVGKTDRVQLSNPLNWLEITILLGLVMTGLTFLLKKKKQDSSLPG